MRKIFLILFLLFLNFSSIFAYDKPKIISREEWWANLDFSDKNSSYWQEIRENNEKKEKSLTLSQKLASEKIIEKNKKINELLFSKYSDYNQKTWKIDYFYEGRELVWPIEYSAKIDGIVIHHTEWVYKNSFQAIRSIQRFHSLSRAWWDIWYNFLIWQNWEIFEGRMWWETAVWAHALWNNIWNIWIAVIWNYDKKEINDEQKESLEKLVKYLVEKYNIDLSRENIYFRNCKKNCIEPIEVLKKEAMIWHRDAWYTTCPWDKLYHQMEDLRSDLIKNLIAINNNPVLSINTSFDLKEKKYFPIFERVWEKKLLDWLVKFEEILENESNPLLLELKEYIIKYFKSKEKLVLTNKTEKNIKIKLSYPENSEFITISDGIVEKKIEKIENKLFVDWEEVEKFSMKNGIFPYLEITSWDRTNSWDKEKKYKDNRFRWEIIVYLKDDKLIVVNNLQVEDYLKWLWEISNDENIEKAKAIIISARTYALWYIEKDRKFKWEFYDGSDDSEIFQKYIGYDLELRSPNLNKIVEQTKWIILTYKWELIKPWYFSASEGQTLSFYEYCINNKKNSLEFCEKEKIKYPFLQSKKDLGGIWKTKSWHWVWLSGTWASYFSKKWWTWPMILKYFYDWIDL